MKSESIVQHLSFLPGLPVVLSGRVSERSHDGLLGSASSGADLKGKEEEHPPFHGSGKIALETRIVNRKWKSLLDPQLRGFIYHGRRRRRETTILV